MMEGVWCVVKDDTAVAMCWVWGNCSEVQLMSVGYCEGVCFPSCVPVRKGLPSILL